MKINILAPLWALSLAVALLFGATDALAQPRSFTTITKVTTNVLSNGVQITIAAYGILQFTGEDGSGSRMSAFFPDARNGTGKNFINLNRYPVSTITLSTPQGAQNGIGLRLEIANFISTTATYTKTPDGQGVLITIQSDRTLPGAARAGSSGAATAKTGEGDDTSASVSFDDGLISIRAVNADIHELMGAIAQKSGFSVAVDDAVTRKVSLNLQGVTPDSAVRTVAAAYGLAIAPINGITMLTQGETSDLATYRASETQSFRIQNTQAGTLSGLLPNFLSGFVKVNAEQNAIVVTAPSLILDKIGRDLKKVDIVTPQILIEAIAVELSDTTDLDIGLRLGNPTSNQFASADVGGGVLSYSTVGALPRNFEARLRALELKGRARVRARPQMVVVNGEDANLFIGSQRFILTQFNQSGQTQNRIQPVDVGVKLFVKPLTGGNGEITTRIAPEVSNITEIDLATGLPVLSTRRSDTTVRVKDGETIAIGGLTLDQDQNSRGKIPFLGDIPILGKIFRSRKRSSVRTELVIFVTPRILTADDAFVVNSPPVLPPTGTAPASNNLTGKQNGNVKP